MRVSTIFATALVVFATGAAAGCTSDNDCPRGQTCQFTSTKNSQGECYKRGEGPAAARRRKRSIPDFDEWYNARREYLEYMEEL